MKVKVKIVSDTNNTVKLNNFDFFLIVDGGTELATLTDIIFKNGYNVLIKKVDHNEED